jgi:hypothetical protein
MIIDIQSHQGIIDKLRENKANSVLIQSLDTLPKHSVLILLTLNKSEWWIMAKMRIYSLFFNFNPKKVKNTNICFEELIRLFSTSGKLNDLIMVKIGNKLIPNQIRLKSLNRIN